MFEALTVSSLIKKRLSSTCRVILAWNLLWPRGCLPVNTDDSCWNLSIKVYATSSTRNTNDLLEPQRLQSYNTNSSWQWGQTDQTKCDVNLHCSAKYLKFIAKYLLARQFLMSRRQCSSNKLLSLQKCQFFFRRTQFLEFCSRFSILLIVYWIVFCLVSSNVKPTRNNDSKLFQKFLFL